LGVGCFVAVITADTGCSHWRHPGGPPPPTSGTSPSATITDHSAAAVGEPLVQIGPISFFQQSCARCHGAYGMMLDNVSLHNRSDDDLARIVRDMVRGPSQTSLDGRSTAALVAYQRSLGDTRPFLAVTRLDGGTIEGEVTPGASVSVTMGTQRVIAEVTQHIWRAHLDGAAAATASVEANIGDAATVLSLPGSAFSHATTRR
jgi:hypothetical protein